MSRNSLYAEQTDAEILKDCEAARRYHAATVCVKSYAVKMAKEALAGSSVGVCSVIGFPHGNNATPIKVAEAEQAIRDGSTEIDMVINIGKVLGGDYNYQGATERNLKLMRQHSAPEAHLKAAGGVRNLDQLLKVRELGCARSGATATEVILEEAKTRGYE